MAARCKSTGRKRRSRAPSLKRPQQARQLHHTNGLRAVAQRVAFGARVDQPSLCHAKIVAGLREAFAGRRGARALDFIGNLPASAALNQQLNLGALARAAKPGARVREAGVDPSYPPLSRSKQSKPLGL